MANVRFNLKNRSEDSTLVSAVFRYDGKRLVYSTGQKINPKFWNDKEQKARENAKFPEYPEFNAYLKKIEIDILNVYRRHKTDGKALSLDGFKKELDILLHKTEKEKLPTLFEFIENLIHSREHALSRPKGSIQVYRKSFKHLKDFAASTKRKIDFADIDLDFMDQFLQFLYSEPRSLSSNYALKILQNLKMFLAEASERGYNNHTAYRSRKFTIKKEETDNIYLTLEELRTLSELDLQDATRLEKVRDLFLIGSYTGLRFSDFTNLKKEHFKKVDGVDVIEIVTKKTKERVVIPMHPIVKSILKRYKSQVPPVLSNQKMNDYLKELGERAGISDLVTRMRTKGGKRTDEVYKKHELMSTHTARRSFATNAFKAGISSISIMKITGHNTETAFLKYIKVSNAENAVLMSKNAFFLN